MNRVIVKVEGNGNGIKTVVCNIAEIASVLSRNVEHLMKFFAHELAVTQKFKDEKWILTGNFPGDTIQDCIFDFIGKFVLCKKCRNPETVIQIDDQKDCYLNCKACSQLSLIARKEKLCNVFVKDQKPVEKSRKSKKKEKTSDETEEEKFDRATREALEGEEIQADAPALQNPVELLKEFLATQPTDEEVGLKVFDLKGDYGLSDRTVVSLVFEALFDENIVEQIDESHKRMRRFLKVDTQKDLITNLMHLCADKNILPKFKIALKKFYDYDVLSEEAIINWHEAKAVKGLSKETQASLKESAQPLIDWLRQNEEDEDEDEEDEEDEDD
eukprot:NODE_2512_length_1181_cov_27.063604_g2294_i0.p1 GENE.NODE_2512_length_1181_cov_27.063604_g2294_i0~~NODE_2512_length_1181_cov_27.063604_g2294_i0.p1  ORF type:complete len:360 (+),score=79.81 NODE_2512_length_1181_cov_27.063604_g2294_i0:95-1081(+)